MYKYHFTIFFLLIVLRVQAQKDSVIELIDSDLSSFWNYYDELKKDTTKNPFAQYFEKGTPALKAYAEHWDKAPSYFKQNIIQHPEYFEKVRHTVFLPANYQKEITTYFEKFKDLYPEAIAPKVYFIGGALTTLCHTNAEGVIIGADLFADSAYRLNDDFKAFLHEQLPVRTAQCMIRFNSRTAYIGYNLMREAIVDGSVVFLTSLLSEEFKTKFTSGKAFQYGEAHEELLVKEFMKRKYDSDFTGWSYWSDGTDRPTGLGSWIGYKITEAYYLNAPDRKKAIDDILEINDFEKFLELSGYARIFSN